MNTLRLRKLTEKSILGFGKYTDLTVGNLLALGRTRELRWIYYHCSMITFMDDILDKISCYPEYRIKKPGVNPDMHNILNARFDENITGITKNIVDSTRRKKLRMEIAQFKKRDNLYFTKGNMQRRNQS